LKESNKKKKKFIFYKITLLLSKKIMRKLFVVLCFSSFLFGFSQEKKQSILKEMN
jgi:hypothetical protein